MFPQCCLFKVERQAGEPAMPLNTIVVGDREAGGGCPPLWNKSGQSEVIRALNTSM